ncbi:T9SS type A sorting domain-containing protein [Flavobacterium sp.]|uniref:T9SS type A sorting domain-containing protein n=1 Tax=Flavobacterium sp. TaxID=239 RepID=UPI003F698A19
MKRRLLLTFALAAISLGVNAQTASTTTTLGSTGMTAKIETSATQVTLTLTGPSNRWLAIGFGGSQMSSATDMFIWNATANRDYTPSGGYSAPSPDAAQSWTVTSDNVSGTTRTVIATRALVSSGDFTFTNTATSIPVIFALGSSSTISNHSNRGATTISRTLANDEFTLEKSSIFPNPSNGAFTIATTTSLTNVAVYTLTGSFVKNIEIKDAEINEVSVDGLSSGIYLLELSNETEKVWKKVVVE